jgi:transcriptional antiterminator Rof (Rho-off)
MGYKQISCSLYDRIESLALTRQKVNITYLKENEQIMVKGIIENIFSENKAEYLIINDTKIRLDEIVSILEQ